jgi:hypothetical protein
MRDVACMSTGGIEPKGRRRAWGCGGELGRHAFLLEATFERKANSDRSKIRYFLETVVPYEQPRFLRQLRNPQPVGQWCASRYVSARSVFGARPSMSVSARESGARLREEVQRALARSAKETTRVWFEQTVGNCGRWRGNDSESCRLAVEQSCQARDGFGGEPAPAASVSGWGVAKYHAAFELMRSEYCDDKLAGMIMFEVRRATTARPVPVGSLPSDTSRMLGRAFPARARARDAPRLSRASLTSPDDSARSNAGARAPRPLRGRPPVPLARALEPRKR